MNTEHLKTKLEQEKKLLEAELGNLGSKDKETGDWEATTGVEFSTESDENDRADKFEEFEERSGTLSELEIRLREIISALEKIEGGAYGICEKCNLQIEEDRLEANPAASTCKSCMNI